MRSICNFFSQLRGIVDHPEPFYGGAEWYLHFFPTPRIERGTWAEMCCTRAPITKLVDAAINTRGWFPCWGCFLEFLNDHGGFQTFDFAIQVHLFLFFEVVYLKKRRISFRKSFFLHSAQMYVFRSFVKLNFDLNFGNLRLSVSEILSQKVTSQEFEILPSLYTRGILKGRFRHFSDK